MFQGTRTLFLLLGFIWTHFITQLYCSHRQKWLFIYHANFFPFSHCQVQLLYVTQTLCKKKIIYRWGNCLPLMKHHHFFWTFPALQWIYYQFWLGQKTTLIVGNWALGGAKQEAALRSFPAERSTRPGSHPSGTRPLRHPGITPGVWRAMLSDAGSRYRSQRGAYAEQAN